MENQLHEGFIHLTNNTGYLIQKLPQNVISELNVSVNKLQSNTITSTPFNHVLAGQIDKEYEIHLESQTTQYIKKTIDHYHQAFPNYLTSINKQTHGFKPRLRYEGEGWINFQKKYEYNPIHNHSGVFSFVIWHKIPYYKEDEIKYGAGKGKTHNNANGDFFFVYPDGGEVSNHPLGIDKTREGYIAIFPSNLLHVVYPFYSSDDYRITISGNIYLK